MRKSLRKTMLLPYLVAAAAVAAVTGACADTGTVTEHAATVDTSVSGTIADVHIDYPPLDSPEDAVAKADLTVEGTVVEVADGIALQFPDSVYTQRWASSFATVVVAVDSVISGGPGHSPGGALAPHPVQQLISRHRPASTSSAASTHRCRA